MSYFDEEIDEDDGIVMERIVVDENLERRKAREIISQAMMSASTPLENRGVKHRMLPGLWYSAVNTLIACLDVDDIIRLLNDRIRGIVGSAENADAPPREFSDQSMEDYISEVGVASETIMEALDVAHEAMEDNDIEDRFPETVFDTTLRVLIPAWGPDHVRRAIMEQSSIFLQGRMEAVNFMEPSRILDPSAARRRAVAETQRDVTVPAATRVQEFEFKPRVVHDRKIRIFVGSDVLDSGRGIWAVTMFIRDDSGRYEFRKFGGRLNDPNGGRVALVSVQEACVALAVMKGRAQVTIETTDEMLLRAIETGQGGAPGARRESDRETWAEVDHVIALHDVTVRMVPIALSDALQESCDHLLRDLSQF